MFFLWQNEVNKIRKMQDFKCKTLTNLSNQNLWSADANIFANHKSNELNENQKGKNISFCRQCTPNERESQIGISASERIQSLYPKWFFEYHQLTEGNSPRRFSVHLGRKPLAFTFPRLDQCKIDTIFWIFCKSMSAK